MWCLPCCLPRSRWSVLVCCMYLELCGGSVYITNLYLASLRPLFFSSSDAETRMEYLVFACNLGNWLPLAGFIYDSRFGGPRNVVYIGAALTAVGYGGLYLCSAFRLGASFWQLCLLWFLWGHGSGYFDCVAIAVGTSNFRESRGMVVGITKSFYGLSGSLLAQPFTALFRAPESAPSFLLFLAVTLSTLAASVAPFIHRLPSPPRNTDAARRRFLFGYTFVAALAVALVSASLLRAFTPLGHSHPFSLGMLFFVIASLLALPLFARGAPAAPSAPAPLHRARTGPAAIDPATAPLVAYGMPDNAGDGAGEAAEHAAESLINRHGDGHANRHLDGHNNGQLEGHEDGHGDGRDCRHGDGHGHRHRDRHGDRHGGDGSNGSNRGDGNDGECCGVSAATPSARLLTQREDSSDLGCRSACSSPSPSGCEAGQPNTRRDISASGGAVGVGGERERLADTHASGGGAAAVVGQQLSRRGTTAPNRDSAAHAPQASPPPDSDPARGATDRPAASPSPASFPPSLTAFAHSSAASPSPAVFAPSLGASVSSPAAFSPFPATLAPPHSHALAVSFPSAPADTPPLPADTPPLPPNAAAPHLGSPKLGSAAPPGLLAQMRNPDLWLLFVAAFAGFGGGIVLLNHVQKIVAAALGGPTGDPALAEQTSSILVSILSAFNCLGRMVAGARKPIVIDRGAMGFSGVGSDYLRGRVPRPVLLAAAVTAMGAAHLSLTQARTPAPLYACCCVAGTAYGCVWSLLPAIVGDLFPPSRFATFYNLFSLSASSSSLLLSTLLATKVYAAHAHTAGAAVVAECSGPECYRDTHMGVVAVCVGGAACALAVAGRNRHIYGRLGAAG